MKNKTDFESLKKKKSNLKLKLFHCHRSSSYHWNQICKMCM